jgi:hypothetical protein
MGEGLDRSGDGRDQRRSEAEGSTPGKQAVDPLREAVFISSAVVSTDRALTYGASAASGDVDPEWVSVPLGQPSCAGQSADARFPG